MGLLAASLAENLAKMLKRLGAYIIDADKLAREVVEPGEPAWQDIFAWLGKTILLPDGHVNRAALGGIVFRDKEALRRLENITHPRIKIAAEAALSKAAAAGSSVAVLDVPLLFESGWDDMVSETWVVYVDSAAQIKRLMARDHLSWQEALVRIGSQMDLLQKAELADVVIVNNNIGNTKKQVEAAWFRLLSATTAT